MEKCLTLIIAIKMSEDIEKMNRLSVGEFIELLQMEFISRKMRSIFYDDSKVKSINAEIAEKKRER